MVKNCDLGQFFTIRTSQPTNNIYICLEAVSWRSTKIMVAEFRIINKGSNESQILVEAVKIKGASF